MTVHATTVRDLPDALHDEGLFVERLAGLALVEQHDARVVIPEQELVRRAEHALAGHAGDLQVTDHGAVGHRGSR